MTKNVSSEELIGLVEEQELPQKEVAKILNISVPTLRRKLEQLRTHRGLIADVKDLENLRLTTIKEQLLTKIEEDINYYEPDQTVRALNAIARLEAVEEKGKENPMDTFVQLVVGLENRGMPEDKLDQLKDQGSKVITPILKAPDSDGMPNL